MPQSGMSSKATGKMRMPSADSRSAFRQQQLPYARPPQSVRSVSLPSGSTTTSPGPSAIVLTSKKATSTSAHVKNDLYEKLSDFTRETESQIGEGDDQHTRRYLAKMNYAVRDKELEMQRSQMAEERANADVVHRRDLERMEKDIERKNAEESCIARQVQMLQLQIQLEELQCQRA